MAEQAGREREMLLPSSSHPMPSPKRLINLQHWLYPSRNSDNGYLRDSRTKLKHFLSSKVGHYAVLTLVILDVAGIFADFVINLFKCEKQWGSKGWDETLEALGMASLIFSSLFMFELIASIWAFGLEYFRSWFHCFDAFVITAAFALDVALRGITEEAASLIVILRLWRVFKIIEELSVGAQEQMEELQARIEDLEKSNRELEATAMMRST
ncbi:uncharacterized protein PV09_09065 [Verruconis gallopava]|uniref:Voltage-gated hydrogen channel 1 n=1 Tax=Verruconis gallopava TaxID=253628 RepID=A0A0D2AK13_9PEZI|nr:uncharacterized protein PV09_09065 [Verruconis gallopava]KIV99298.1 hypothetical protein PV09_09065 [Verruconis gallopava]